LRRVHGSAREWLRHRPHELSGRSDSERRAAVRKPLCWLLRTSSLQHLIDAKQSVVRHEHGAPSIYTSGSLG
jgi:hypothetical protein